MNRETKKSVKSAAGRKLLLHAMKRNVASVERRYRDEPTRHLCNQVSQACDLALQCIESGRNFEVYVAWQPNLPDYDTNDEEYGKESHPDQWPF